MRKVVMVAIVSGIVMALSAPAYAVGPFKKLGRGVANLATGWLELPAQVGRATELQGSVAGLTAGVARGVLYGIGRTLVGALETVTFPFPNHPNQGVVGDAELYGPILEPEFVVLRQGDQP